MKRELEPEVIEALLNRERTALVSRLLPGLVHNLSGAVQLVRLPLDLMEMKLDQPEPEYFRAKLASSQDGMNRLNEQLELLGARIGYDQDIEPRVFDLGQLAAEQLAFWPGDLFFKHETALETDLASVPLSVRAAYADVALAFNALIRNALEALNAKELTALFVGSEKRDGRATLLVRDQGGGPEPADIPGIFEPFSGQKDAHEGLGLYLAQKALAAWRGEISFQPGPGGGFLISLPLVA